MLDKTFLRKYIFRKEVYLILLAIIATLWRAYPHLFLAPSIFPSDEHRPVSNVFSLVRRNGFAFNPFYIPYLEFYILYIVNLIFNVDILKLCLFANPIIGGLSIFAFYFFISGILNDRKSLLATVLFAFSETHYYRTCHFATTESLGILLMFLFFGFYLRKQKIPTLLTLIVMPFAHTLPFIFSVSVVMIHLLNRGGKLKVILIMCAMTVLFLSTGIHTKQTIDVLRELYLNFKLSNLFIYNISDILEYFLCYSGIIALSLLAIFNFRNWTIENEIIKPLIIMSIIGMFITLLCYNNSVGPTRFLLYLTIPLVIIVTKNIKNEKKLAILVTIMIASPLMGGLNKVIWVADSITPEEIVAFEWFETRGYFLVKGDFGYNETYFGNWFYDSTVKHYVELYTGRNWMGYPCFLNYRDKNASSIRQLGKALKPKYVFLSERIKNSGLFIDEIEDGVKRSRSLIVRVPIEDIWKGDPSWREIYNFAGVVVYENVFLMN